MVRSLLDKGLNLRIFCLTQGEYYAETLKNLGVEPIFVGRRSNRVVRIMRLFAQVSDFKPHIIQSSHFYTNLYVGLVGKATRTVSIGSLRNDGNFEYKNMGGWSPWLMRLPDCLLVNSYAARDFARCMGIDDERIFVLQNVIDLEQFNIQAGEKPNLKIFHNQISVILIARLVRQKRIDRFIKALALARKKIPDIVGLIVGAGPEKDKLENLAHQVGLLPGGLYFLGQRDDVPAILTKADILILTSEHEGFPNVILEAMAAGVPIITMPAGDAGRIVTNSLCGLVVSSDDTQELAKAIVNLAASPEKRRTLGQAGRQTVGNQYHSKYLGDRLISIYQQMAPGKSWSYV